MAIRRWTEFREPAPRRVPDEIRSSINPKGEITFDLTTYEKMGAPQAMVLLYEPSTKTIGLKPAHPEKPNAVLVRIRHARSNRVVRSQAFMRANGIKLDRTFKFAYPRLEDNILALDLRTAVPYGNGAWKKVRKRR